MVQRVPQRHFAAPESLVVMSYRGISERAVVPIKKRLSAEHHVRKGSLQLDAEQHLRKGREDKQAEQQGKTLGREPILSVLNFGRRVRGEPHSHRGAICFETRTNPSENCASPRMSPLSGSVQEW